MMPIFMILIWKSADHKNHYHVSMSDPVVITPLKDGPNEVAGANIVKDEAGNIIKEGEKVYLCRCGHSANKPFCDGSHKREGWTSD